ncbi:MAG: HDOD domain-containing protein [Deltaproteobacteria bacterium]|nr:HDOD domain-containing protein [Deltaproteobacteria bacterium]
MAEARRATENTFGFLDEMRELPSLPQVLVKIARVASDPKASAAEMAEVILRDQALTLKLLRIANSARYALYAQRVTTVSRAVMLLGFQSVRAMSLGLGTYHLLSALQRGGAILEGFWREAISTAVICQELAGLFGVTVSEEAFVAGLLHDVGKLVLAQHDPERASQLYGSAPRGPGLLAAERELFGVDHTGVAGELARRWELPEVLRKAMTQHHRCFSAPPSDRGDLLAFLVSAAKTLSGALSGDSPDAHDLAPKLARVLRKPVGPVLGILQGLPARLCEYASFFEIEVGDLKVYALWVEEENRRLSDVFSEQEGERRRTEARRAEMAAIREVHALLVQGAARETVILRVLRAAREIAGSRRTVVGLGGGPAAAVRPAWADGDVTPAFLEGFVFPRDEEGVITEVLRAGQTVHAFDARMPYFSRLLSAREARTLDAPCFAVLPILKDTETIGVLYADRNEGEEPFHDDDIETLATLADLISLALRG